MEIGTCSALPVKTRVSWKTTLFGNQFLVNFVHYAHWRVKIEHITWSDCDEALMRMVLQMSEPKLLRKRLLIRKAILRVAANASRPSDACVRLNYVIIALVNGSTPIRRQTIIIWINSGRSLIRSSWSNFSELWIKMQLLSYKNMYMKMWSAKWRSFWLGLDVLTHCSLVRQ